MKKFLLFAAAALFVSSVSAQKVSVMRTMPDLQEKKAVKYEAVPAKKVGKILKKRNSKAELQMPVMNVAKPLSSKATAVNRVSKNAQRAGQIAPSYDASGKNYRSGESETWTLTSGTFEESEEPCLVNVIPSPFTNLPEIPVAYSVDSKGDVTIPAQKVAQSVINDEGSEKTLYVYLINPLTSSSDNSIHLTLGDDGSLTPVDGYMAYYFFLSDKIEFTQTNVYYSLIYYNVKYSLGGLAPTTMFDIDNAVLFANQSLAGNYWLTNMAITGADAPVSLLNTSDGKATSWAWSVTEGETPMTSTDVDYQFTATRDMTYTDFTLTGTNGENSSTFKFGFGNAKGESSATYEAFEMYGGGSQSVFGFSNGLYPIMSRFNPDGDLTYYSNFATPDKAGEGNSFHKIISYQGKPSAPLYITGITLPVILNSYNEDFHLDVKIYKASEDGGLGDLIATGTATAENINDEYASTSGLSAISFPLSIEDEFEMSTEVGYIFIEDAFFIVIEGWDNGTFSAILGSQNDECEGVYSAQQESTWFTLTGDADEDWYSWTGWNTSLFIGLDGAAYGYLATNDNTNITIPAAGGEAKINVEPMLIYNDDNGNPTTGIWKDYESEELPEWLSVSIDDHYTLNSDQQLTEANFDLIFSAEALPGGVEGRQANLIFMQPGARLKVTVTQGEASGINVAVTKLDSKSAAYNLAGQRVNNSYKGLVIKDGRKFMNK